MTKNGQSCTQLILATNFKCYDNATVTSCCQLCNFIARSDIGNGFNVNYAILSFVIKNGQTCTQLILDTNFECYDNSIVTSCCQSCNFIARSDIGKCFNVICAILSCITLKVRKATKIRNRNNKVLHLNQRRVQQYRRSRALIVLMPGFTHYE